MLRVPSDNQPIAYGASAKLRTGVWVKIGVLLPSGEYRLIGGERGFVHPDEIVEWEDTPHWTWEDQVAYARRANDRFQSGASRAYLQHVLER